MTDKLAESRRLDEAANYASDIGVLGVLQALTRLRGLILLPVIARLLGTGAYGVWTQSLVMVNIGSLVVDMQLHTALVRFISGSDDRDEQRAYFVPLLVVVGTLGALAAGAMAAAPDFIATNVLGDANYAGLAQWLGLWIALRAVSQIGLHTLRALQRVKLYGVLGTAHTLAQLAAVAAVVLLWRDLLLAVLAALALEGLLASLVLVLSFRALGLGWPGLAKLRPSLAFSLPLVPTYYAGTALNFADRLFIAAALGAEAVGAYAAAYSLARIVREIYKPVSTALLPAISRVWDRGDKGQGRWLLTNTMRYYLLLALPALVGVVALGERALNLLAPEAVVERLTVIIALVGVGLLLSSLQSVFSVLLHLAKDTAALAVSRVISAAVYVGLVAIAVPRWGLPGAAAATLVGYGLDLVITSRLAWRRDRFDLPVEPAAKAALGSGGMSLGVLLALRVQGLGGLLMAAATGVIVYVLLMLAQGGLGRRELRFLRRAAGLGGPETTARSP